MKQRIVSAVALVALLLMTVACSGIPLVLNAVMAIIAGTGLYEILKVCGVSFHKMVTAGMVLFAAGFVFFSDPLFPKYRTILTLATFVLILAVFTYYLRGYKAVPINMMVFSLMITVMIAYFFSAVVLTRKESDPGLWNMILIFIFSWIPDTGAYFCGSLFGKHKLCPIISPKKTIEGAVGGIVACGIISYLYAFLVGHFAGYQVNWWIIALYAGLGTAVSMLGDLTASLIKRTNNVKDYGSFIPGHGGIMDRFDSVWFVAPFVWLMLDLCPIFS